MPREFKLVVTLRDVGVVVDVASAQEASAAVRQAREFLGQIGQSSSVSRLRAKAGTSGSLSERILGLGVAFFKEPQESVSVSKALARSAFHYEAVRVRDELRRLVRRGQLRRIGDGTRANPFKYVNP
jgi:hypothetical protein